MSGHKSAWAPHTGKEDGVCKGFVISLYLSCVDARKTAQMVTAMSDVPAAPLRVGKAESQSNCFFRRASNHKPIPTKRRPSRQATWRVMGTS